MLSDIVHLNNVIFIKNISKPFNNPKAVYDSYRALSDVIRDTETVAKHYLALTFEEDYLQGSSFGSPQAKWLFFVNRDMDALNETVKIYLTALSRLGIIKKNGSGELFMDRLYNSKSRYSFIRDEYCVGKVDKDLILRSQVLSISEKASKRELLHVSDINLQTYEQRLELKNNLNKCASILKKEHEAIKTAIVNRYTISDLM